MSATIGRGRSGGPKMAENRREGAAMVGEGKKFGGQGKREKKHGSKSEELENAGQPRGSGGGDSARVSTIY